MTHLTNDLPRRRAWASATALAVGLWLTACAAPGAPTGALPGGAGDDGGADLACTLPSNCVNSLAGSGLAPLRFEGSAEQAMAALKATLAGWPEATIERAEGQSLTAVFTTPVGFKDRVDFRIDTARQRVDFRSRSLLGLYDFGKNRSRMAAFARSFEARSAR